MARDVTGQDIKGRDYLVAALLFVGSFAAIGLAQRDQGVVRDESHYFSYAERYWRWFAEMGDKVEVFDYSKYNFVTPIMKPAAMERADLLDRVMNNYRRFYSKKALFHYPWRGSGYRRQRCGPAPEPAAIATRRTARASRPAGGRAVAGTGRGL